MNRNIYRVKYFTVILHDKGIPFEIPRRPTSLARNDRDASHAFGITKWAVALALNGKNHCNAKVTGTVYFTRTGLPC